MDDTFSEALIHVRPPWHARARGLSAHVVLGRRLRPFAYWHAFLLDAIGSPLAGHDGGIDLPALALAVDSCCAVYPYREARTWRSVLRHHLQVWRFGLGPLTDEIRAFAGYLADYQTSPVYAQSANAAPIKTHWTIFAVAKLLRTSSLSPREAWMTPIGEGHWRNCAADESAGHSVDILSPELRAAFAEAAAAAAARPNSSPVTRH